MSYQIQSLTEKALRVRAKRGNRGMEINKKSEMMTTFKKLLFAYLALSKLLYWINYIGDVIFSDVLGFDLDSVVHLILTRLITHDLFVIACVVVSFLVFTYIKRTAIAFIVFYLMVIALGFGNYWVQARFFGADPNVVFEYIMNFETFTFFTISFIAVSVIMEIKDRMKKAKYKAEAEEYAPSGGMSDFSNALICNSCKVDLQDKLSLFGQFVGEWKFEKIIEKGTQNEKRITGEWIFSWILDGTAIQDVFITPTRKEREKGAVPHDEYGTTIRFYNLATDAWDMYYGILGTTQVLEGKQVGDQIIVKCKSESTGLMQQTFSNITPSSFSWLVQRSNDNGDTWNDALEVTAQRK